MNNMNPELFTRVRKFISCETPEEFENASRILYAHKVEYRGVIYSDKGKSYCSSWSDIDRIDIVMNYKLIDEPQILKWLGIKSDKLYIYADHG